MNTVELDTRKRLVVRTPYEFATVLQQLPDARVWNAAVRAWVVAPSRINIEHLRARLPDLVWSPDALALVDGVLARGTAPALQTTDGYDFGSPLPYAHQVEGFRRSRGAPAFALLMEQRTGKTRVVVDTATDLFLRGKLDLVLVVCPNSVKDVWDEQIPQWTPSGVGLEVLVYDASVKTKRTIAERLRARRPGILQWVVANVEAFSIWKDDPPSGAAWFKEVLGDRAIMAVIDEASRIKHPKAQRTKHLLKMRPMFAYRRILTGTLVTQGPLDVYAPFAFLDPAILGYSSYYAFRNDYAIMGGWNQKQVIGYVHPERLTAILAPFSFRVTRDECWDLPPKTYVKLSVTLSPEQRRLYDAMRDTMLAELSDQVEVGRDGITRPRKITTSQILVQLTRLQQITGGFVPPPLDESGKPIGEPSAIPGPNPKIEALLAALEEESGSGVIWCRYRAEIDAVVSALRVEYGHDAVVEFHGGVSTTDRGEATRRFQGGYARWFVGNAATGGLGIDLSRASGTWYFSNSFALEERLQSEDRVQHRERTTPAGYTDLVAKGTLDTKILAALREKKGIADLVNGDNLKDWL